MKEPVTCKALIAVIVLLLVLGCSRTSSTTKSSPSISIQQRAFHYTDVPVTTTVTLPQQLNDANWGVKETICEKAEYSLRPYAGQTITSTKYTITETYSGEPLYLWVLEQNQKTICAYFSVREASTLTPGLFAAGDPRVK